MFYRAGGTKGAHKRSIKVNRDRYDMVDAPSGS